MTQDKNERYFFLPDCRSIHVHSHARVGEVLDGVVGRAAGASVKAHGNLLQQNFLDFLLELWKTGREKKVNISKKKREIFSPFFIYFCLLNTVDGTTQNKIIVYLYPLKRNECIVLQKNSEYHLPLLEFLIPIRSLVSEATDLL